MTEPPDDDALSTALQRLPYWSPPPGFTQRLTAAAARQAATRPAARSHPAMNALALISAVLPQTVAASLAALVLIWLPWDLLAANPDLTAFGTVALLGSAGLWLTFRTLRS